MQKPNRKVTVGGAVGALTTIAVSALEQLGFEVDAVTAAAILTVLTFASSYLVPEPPVAPVEADWERRRR